MVVSIGFAIVAAGAISKTDFVNQPGFFQVAQRVVNGRVADAGQTAAGSLEDVAGGGVVIAFLDNLEHRLPLGRQLRPRLVLLLCAFHDGFRLILNLGFVKPRILRMKDRIFAGEVDDLVDVSFEWWTLNAVPGEQLLCVR